MPENVKNMLMHRQSTSPLYDQHSMLHTPLIYYNKEIQSSAQQRKSDRSYSKKTTGLQVLSKSRVEKQKEMKLKIKEVKVNQTWYVVCCFIIHLCIQVIY